MPAESRHNLLADLESARRNADLQDALSLDESKSPMSRHKAAVLKELWLCEVQWLETRVHSMPGGVVQNPSEQNRVGNIGVPNKGVSI